MGKITTRYYTYISFEPNAEVDASINESGSGLQELFIDGDDFLSIWNSLSVTDRESVHSILIIKDRSDRNMRVIARWRIGCLLTPTLNLDTGYRRREKSHDRRIILKRQAAQIEKINRMLIDGIGNPSWQRRMKRTWSPLTELSGTLILR
mgnify:FL=1